MLDLVVTHETPAPAPLSRSPADGTCNRNRNGCADTSLVQRARAEGARQGAALKPHFTGFGGLWGPIARL